MIAGMNRLRLGSRPEQPGYLGMAFLFRFLGKEQVTSVCLTLSSKGVQQIFLCPVFHFLPPFLTLKKSKKGIQKRPVTLPIP